MTDLTVIPQQTATPGQVAWLRSQLPLWQAAGLVGETEGATILSRYRAAKRLSLGRLMLYLGSSFVGVGVIWLVAANLDRFAPLARFGAVVLLWLAATALAELLVTRPRHGDGTPVTGAARGLAALMFGAVVFQAAQSLQVPAYEPSLVGWWGLGALLYAYAVRGVAPLVVGLVTSVVWFLWQTVERSGGAAEGALATLVAGAAAVAVAGLHERLGWPGFVAAWREVGALLLLVGLFVAAVPDVDGDLSLDPTTWAAIAVAGLLVAGAALAGRGSGRLEPLAAAGVVLVGCLLLWWDPGTDLDDITPGDWAHAAVSVAAYVALGAGVAALGIVRDSGRLTFVALAAVVVFTTFQSFAVFAQIITGAWLFLVLGLVFLGSGYVFDRARRELTESLEGATS